MQRLVLFDGNAILHRAYHALPPLTTKDGRQVNAVYGFVSMLLRVLTDLKATHVAVAFDRPAPTFRKQLFKQYQAQRPKMEDGLSSQIAMVHQVVETMGIPIFEMDGWEADDILGTIAIKVSLSLDAGDLKLDREPRSLKLEQENQASTLQLQDQSSSFERQASNQDIEVVIVTGDRDILQLVNERIKVYMPVKGLSEGKLFGEEEVKERMGVRPSSIVDYKALIGDSSDNYPGVSGIGPKTAVNLLAEFGTFEKIYEHLHEIKSEILRQKLEKGKEQGELSKQLATIITDVPVQLDFDQCKLKPFDTPEVYALFDDLQFRSLATRLSLKEGPQSVKKDIKKEQKVDDAQLSLV